MSPRELPQLLWEVIRRNWRDRDVTFTQAWPKQAPTGPTIAWKIHKRLPGMEGLERLKPRIRKEFRDPDGESVDQIWAQWHTVWYQFDLFDVTDPDVDSLADDFESLMFSLTGFLQSRGVKEFLFDEELEDAKAAMRDDVFVRSYRYLCILERQYPKNLTALQEIFFQLLMDPTPRIDVPIVRGAGGVPDLLPDPWVRGIYYAARLPQGAIPATGDFLAGVDFELCGKDTGEASLRFIEGRAQPDPGETYYVAYSIYTNTPRVPVVPGDPYSWMRPGTPQPGYVTAATRG
jgi:hypothetical protein